MMTQEKLEERLSAATKRAVEVEHQIRGAIQAEYPGLRAWLIQAPVHKWIPRKRWAGDDDGRWGGGRLGGYRSVREKIKALEGYPERAIRYAACRISEAYGVGMGAAWAAKHFHTEGDEAIARSQATVSVHRVIRHA